MGKFSDSNYYILSNYFSEVNAPRNGITNSYILGPRKTVVAAGSLDVELYQKVDNDFISHKFLIQEVDGNNFKFQYAGKLSTHTGAADLTLGEEMYFRKDSLFHDWLRNNAAEYEKAINTNKTFIYFGKLYSVTGETTNYNIIFDGMKDYVVNALPEHNRTDRMIEFLKICFDETYHDVYNMTKTLWSFFDAFEVDIDHLSYLARRANVEVDVEKIDTELLLREFVDQLIYWLKRKGTYTSYYVIYKLLFQNTRNKLNFYEKWCEWCLRELRSGQEYILDSDFENHHYLEHYDQNPSGGSGVEYYSQYNYERYPEYTDVAPVGSCVERSKSCGTVADFTDFTGADDGGNITTQIPLLLQIDEFDPRSGNDLYMYKTPASSAGATRHCLTVSMDASAQASGGVFIWAASNYEDKTLNEHETDTENYIAVSYDAIGTPSGSPTSRRFKVWEHDSGTLYARETSGTYAANTDYYITISKISDELALEVFNDPRRYPSHRIERVRLNLHEDVEYNSLYALNYRTSPYFASWSGDIQSLYERYDVVDTIGPTGYKVLSPHYKIEVDLSSEPFGEDFIIDESHIDELLRYWAYLKPISKFVHYHLLLSPLGKIDELGEAFSLYPKTYTAVCDTRFVGGESLATSAASAATGPAGDFFVNTATLVQPVSILSWIFEHELNSKEVIIQVFDKDDIQIYPAAIWHETFDRSRIQWTPARRGRAFAASMKEYNTTHLQSTELSAWNITHNMGTSGVSGVCCQVFRGDLTSDIIPDTITAISPDVLKITFSEPVSGYAFIRDDDYYHEQNVASTNWIIQHNLNIRGAICNFRDHTGTWIYPAEVFIDDYNTIRATFNEAVSGSASLIIFRREFDEGDVSDVMAQGYWKIGNGGTDEFDPTIHNDLSSTLASGSLDRWIEASPGVSGTFVGIFHVPTGEEYTINEMGLFDVYNTMQYYTRLSTLHKPTNVQLDVWYRIRKASQASS